ncbi:MAG: hypothetical protein ACI9MN_001008, partial [Saprospiraceae bacterium]
CLRELPTGRTIVPLEMMFLVSIIYLLWHYF